MIIEQRLVNTFMDMARIDSPSLHEKDMAKFLYALLAPRGYTIHQDNAGQISGGNAGNLIVRVPATGSGTPLAFSAHMDCVPPCIGVHPVLEKGIIRSDSQTVLGGDDKAGIAAILEALFHLEDENIPHPELWLLFTICEEAGMHGAKNLDPARISAREIVVLDAGGDVGTIIARSPAKADMQIIFHGRSAHAGMEPESGISAIQMAAQAIAAMRLLRIDDDTVANLGRIEGGGPTNIVTDRVRLTAEARSQTEAGLQQQIEHMRQCCRDAATACGGSVDFSHEIVYPALNVSPQSPLLHKALHACNKLDITALVTGTGGGSDANIFASYGLSCINLGIGMSKVHTTEEFIRVEDMVKTTRLVAEMMQS